MNKIFLTIGFITAMSGVYAIASWFFGLLIAAIFEEIEDNTGYWIAGGALFVFVAFLRWKGI